MAKMPLTIAKALSIFMAVLLQLMCQNIILCIIILLLSYLCCMNPSLKAMYKSMSIWNIMFTTFAKQYNLYNANISVLSDMWTECQHAHQAISFLRLCKIVTQWPLTSNYLPSNTPHVDELQAWSQQKFNL